MSRSDIEKPNAWRFVLASILAVLILYGATWLITHATAAICLIIGLAAVYIGAFLVLASAIRLVIIAIQERSYDRKHR